MTKTMPPADDPTDAFAAPSPPSAPAQTHAPAAVDTLKQAMRRARSDDAERAGARAELRNARLARLELLQDSLAPLVAQIPSDVDLFDVALKPGADPRLFIDMIGFVEMGRDARLYRMVQDTRHGRIEVAESEDVDAMVDVVTDYVARRLLERDKALAADAEARRRAEISKWTRNGGDIASRGSSGARAAAMPFAERREPSGATADPEQPTPAAQRSRRSAPVRWSLIAFAFLIDLLGSIAFFTILAAIGWFLWNRAHTPI